MTPFLQQLTSKGKFLFLVLSLISFSKVSAQIISSGPSLVCQGITYPYSVDLGGYCNNVLWTCTNCSIDNPNAINISVSWSSPGVLTATFTCNEPDVVPPHTTYPSDQIVTYFTPPPIGITTLTSQAISTHTQGMLVPQLNSTCQSSEVGIESVTFTGNSVYPFDTSNDVANSNDWWLRIEQGVQVYDGNESTSARIRLYWKNNWTGRVTIRLNYKTLSKNIFGQCFHNDWAFLEEYVITRTSEYPGGILTGNSNVTMTGTATVIDLSYQKAADYTASIQQVKYYKDGVFLEDVYPCDPTFSLHHSVSQPGSFVFAAQILDQWGTWHTGPSQTVTVTPSCLGVANLVSTLVGFSPDPNGLLIIKDSPYTVAVVDAMSGTPLSNFSDNYDLNFSDFGSEVTSNGTGFSTSKIQGNYKISFDKKIGRDDCLAIPVLTVVLDGKNEILPAVDCPLVVPTYFFGKPGFPSASHTDLTLEHFATTLQSKSYIEVLPGVTLDLGAELILLPGTPPVINDLQRNFVEGITFDEYGRVLSSSRDYFDDKGKAIQSQSKSLTDGVVLSTQTIYDAYNRPVISTLTAPTAVRLSDNSKTGCPELSDAGLDFKFKDDFVKAGDNTPYNQTHFDLAKEDSPDPVLNTAPGTLGWYYSSNNGTLSSSDPDFKMNESLVATTNYPYTRALFHRDGSGEVKGGTKVGDLFRAGAGHVPTTDNEPALATDTYLLEYLNVRDNLLPRPATLTGQFFRTVSLGAETTTEKKKSITYTDKGGKTIISLYFGSQASPITKSYNIYDDAGRLLASISPAGVSQYNGTNFNAIEKTTYSYNYKGWLTQLSEPDAGITKYIYRKDGKIRFSQNADQAVDGPLRNKRFSYTNYDRAGRPIESGEYEPTISGIAFASPEMQNILETISSNGGLPDNIGTKREQVFTYYDEPATDIPVQRIQRYTHGGVSRSRNANTSTWYSYDELGRIEWIVQKIEALATGGIKTIDYRYGPTGAVQDVVYQMDAPTERFSHFYEYDLDGRLSKTYTSTAALVYNKNGDLTNRADLTMQANYDYYLHGPLRRVEYPQAKQGIDYVYTVDGALKGINDGVLSNDPGKDGLGNSSFNLDVFGMTVDYYSGDYLTNAGNYVASTTTYPAGTDDQFTSLIKGNRWHSPVDANTQFAYGYRYDQRNQLLDARWGSDKTGTMIFNTTLNPYLESIGGYDLNGNINTLNRKSQTGIDIADFKYNYSGNRLNNITQGSSSTHLRNYTYNAIGQMMEQEDVVNDKKLKTQYDVTGKVTTVFDKDNKLVTTFDYDDRGFRLSKTGYDADGNVKDKTWYIRDASGNTVSTYEQKVSTAGGTLNAAVPIEMPVYGSGKIGLYKPQYGLTFYELTDHLGNVRAVIGDKVAVEYMATMETERINQEEDFAGINSSPTAQYINHTPASVTIEGVTTTIADPNEVIRINNAQDIPKKPIGGGILLWVHPGDKVSMEVYAKYTNFNNNNTTSVAGLASYLAGTFGGATSIIDGVNIFNGLDQTPAGVFAPLGSIDESQPKAFLSYIVFDRNMVPVKFNYDQVSVAAKIPDLGEGDPFTHPHELLALNDISIDKEGFIYIYVSNQSDQNMDVYFDDLKVTHQYSDIVAGGDFYPFGLEIKDRQITRESYRFGYQGKFAEKDNETGWNHFELREYDPVIGRWISTDSYGQYWSPYRAMGNNPANSVDEDGGWDDVHYNSQTNKYSIVETNQADRIFVDGKYIGGGGADGSWKSYADGASVFRGYNFSFYNSFGASLRNSNYFDRLWSNASSTRAQTALMQAKIANKDAKILYGTLAIPLAAIGGGELIAVAPVVSSAYSTIALETDAITTYAYVKAEILATQLTRYASSQIFRGLVRYSVAGTASMRLARDIHWHVLRHGMKANVNFRPALDKIAPKVIRKGVDLLGD